MNFKNIILVLSLLSTSLVFAEPALDGSAVDKSIVEQNNTIQVVEDVTALDTQKINPLLIQKETLEKELSENNIWSKIYSNYHTYKELEKQNTAIDKNIKRLKNMKVLTKKQKQQLESDQEIKMTILGKLQLLKEYEKDPFKKFLTPPTIDVVPTIESPFAVIGALSYREKLQSDIEEYNNRFISLHYVVEKFKEKQ
ncbi:mechanosensitive ion channel family protein, partial [Campylobacterota bacterium]